jgi:predicted metal-dependent phosphoesterase TrpH
MEAFLAAQSPIDLHLRSTMSDGTDAPAGVVRAAHAEGVRTMALTDHDTTAGWAEAESVCRELGMTFIPGMEFTAQGGRGVHLLAYLFDPSHAGLTREMNRIVERRDTRAQVITERLSEDYDISWEDVLVYSEGGTTGRPHIASAMKDRGHIASIDEFFALVHKGSKYYEPSPAVDVVKGIRLVREAGGVPIIAHPTGRGQKRPDGTGHTMPREHLEMLLEAGLAGFELDHRENANNPEGLAKLWEYAAEYDLIVTGSSDFHGTRKPNRPGENTTSPEMLQRIIAEATGTSPTYAERP